MICDIIFQKTSWTEVWGTISRTWNKREASPWYIEHSIRTSLTRNSVGWSTQTSVILIGDQAPFCPSFFFHSFLMRSCTTTLTAQAWAGPTSIPRGAVWGGSSTYGFEAEPFQQWGLGTDMMIGLGTNFWANSLFVLPKNEILAVPFRP